jgi:hypothetical protein
MFCRNLKGTCARNYSNNTLQLYKRKMKSCDTALCRILFEFSFETSNSHNCTLHRYPKKVAQKVAQKVLQKRFIILLVNQKNMCARHK